MIKIAVLAASYPPYQSGGIVTATFNMVNLIKKNHNYQVKVFTYADTVNSNYSSKSQVVRSGIGKVLRTIIKRTYNLLIKIVEGNKDAYQFSDIIISICGAFIARRKVSKFNPDIIISPDQGGPLLIFNKNRNQKIILMVHHNPIRFINKKLFPKTSEIDAKMAVWLESMYIPKVDQVIAPSNYMKRIFNNTYKKYKKTISVIPNIINYSYISQLKKLNFSVTIGSAPKIYIPSGFSLYKGGLHIFEIIAEINQLYKQKITYYISGQTNKEILSKIEAIDPNLTIISPGHLTYEENIGYLKACDICMSPTLLESFGMAIIEAKVCGLPAVYWDAGGNHELPYIDSVDKLVKKEDITTMAREVVKLIHKLKRNPRIEHTGKLVFIKKNKDALNNLFQVLESKVSSAA